jgi:hypothetical protein
VGKKHHQITHSSKSILLRIFILAFVQINYKYTTSKRQPIKSLLLLGMPCLPPQNPATFLQTIKHKLRYKGQIDI